MYRTYRMMATGQSVALLGTVSDLDPATAQHTPGVFQVCMSGATGARPKAGDPDFQIGVQAGIHYLDTSLGYIVISDGANGWRNPASGALV